MMRRVPILAMLITLLVATTATVMAQPGTRQRPSERERGYRQRPPARYQLSRRQWRQIMEIRRDTERRIERINSNPRLTSAQRERRIRMALRDERARIRQVLTPRQRRYFTRIMRDFERDFERMEPGERDRDREGRGPGMTGGQVPGVTSLTADQRNRIMDIRRRTMREVSDIRGNRNLSQQQRDDRIRAAMQRGHDAVMDVLTDEQKEAFREWSRNRR